MSLAAVLHAGATPSMTSYFSLVYLVFFLPACMLIYTLLPQKARRVFLLTASYLFYWLISGFLVLYLMLSTLSVHYFGLWLDRIASQRDSALADCEKAQRKKLRHTFLLRQRRVLAFAVVLHIGVLLALKYTPFFVTNLNSLLGLFHLTAIRVPHILLPIGISFFTLQAISYLCDVYRGTIQADDNLLRLSLFMGFFPQIVEGPICRYQQTAADLWQARPISYDALRLGLMRILFGMMKKLVIADRLNPLIKAVFSDYTAFSGGVIALAAIAYTVQLYMDFSGAMDAVVGTAQIFGVAMPENFERPFFSKTISEFWKRWHITLGTFFRDYIFYPVTMSGPMKKLTLSARKRLGNHFGPLLAGSIALFCVWFCNGLWHGAAWSYLFFGMYHFALILCGNLFSPAFIFINRKLHINSNNPIYQVLQMLRTCILVVVGELFFRAPGLREGLHMFRKMVTDFRLPKINEALLSQLGVDKHDLVIVLATVLIIFIISILRERGCDIRGRLIQKSPAIRWAVLYALILFIVIFGAYGHGYVPVDPIYANF